MRAALIPVFIALAFAQQPAPAPKAFTATAAIGKPYVIGEDPDDYGKIKVDYGKKFEINLDSVESASTTGRYTFTTAAAFIPRALRLTSAATGRVAEIALSR